MDRRLRWWVAAIALLPVIAAAAPLPVGDWVRHPQFSHVQISPDGKYLAVASAIKNSGRYQLVILPTRSVLEGKPRLTAHYSLTDYELFGSIFWVNDGRIAAATATQVGGFDIPFLTGKLFAINVDGGQQMELMGPNNRTYFLGLLDLLRKNRRAILVYGSRGYNNKAVAFWLDVYVSTMHVVAESPVAYGGLLADHNGNVRLAWGNNEKTGWPEEYYRDAHSMNWHDESKLIMSDKAAAALETSRPIMFGPDNKTVYIEELADNPAETTGLYSFNFDTGKKTLLYANSVVGVGGVYSDYSPFIESFSRDNLVGLRIMPGEPETLALNQNAPRMQLLAALTRALPDVQIGVASWTKDGTEAVVRTWSDTEPVMFYLYSSKPKPSLTPLFRETPWIGPDDLSPMRPVSFKSRDGLVLHGYLTVPRGVTPKNLPLVVYVHGGPHGIRYDWGFDPTDFDSVATQILANHGYAVLAPNYRGSGGYGFKFEAAGFRHWGDTMQNDLADAVHWAVQSGIADPKRICVLGASYGGYASLMSAERFPNIFRCAVGYDGVYDLPMLKTRKTDIARYASGTLYEKTVLGNDEKQLKAFSPVYNVQSLKGAVFLLHGGRDERAPVAGFDEMVAAIRKHGTPLETLFEPREGHGFYQPAHRKKAWTEILAFLDKYIGPGVMAGSAADTSN